MGLAGSYFPNQGSNLGPSSGNLESWPLGHQGIPRHEHFWRVQANCHVEGPTVWICFLLSEMKWTEVPQSCPTLCNLMDCSLLGSSTHGIFQARVWEWVAMSFSRESSWPRDQTWVSHIVGRRFTNLSDKDMTWVVLVVYKASCQEAHGVSLGLQSLNTWLRWRLQISLI